MQTGTTGWEGRIWHLPLDLIFEYKGDNVCRCNPSRNDGFTLDPDTGYWVCGNCRKPSKYMLRECENCGKVYLPVEPSKYPAQYYVDVCKECKP